MEETRKLPTFFLPEHFSHFFRDGGGGVGRRRDEFKVC